MSKLAPLHLAQSWDNVGLLAGDRSATVRRVLLCIDFSPAVLAEARRGRCEMVIAYHPPLFKPIKSLVADGATPRSMTAALHAAIRAGIAIYSPHTALDAADGGTGDALAALCGATVTGPLDFATNPGSADEIKISVFVPREQLDRVAEGMFAAGAGRIGLYERCSFRIPGTGTFFGGAGTDPRVGHRGRLESVQEVRLEMICTREQLPETIAALRRTHPYEEPAFDLYPLHAKPEPRGIGRLARLPRPMTLAALARRLARATGSTAPQLIGAPAKRVQRLAILAGSAGRFDQDFPRSRRADVLITGEVRHHDALALRTGGAAVVALGHWYSERPVLSLLARSLGRELKGATIRISRSDADPFGAV